MNFFKLIPIFNFGIFCLLSFLLLPRTLFALLKRNVYFFLVVKYLAHSAIFRAIPVFHQRHQLN